MEQPGGGYLLGLGPGQLWGMCQPHRWSLKGPEVTSETQKPGERLSSGCCEPGTVLCQIMTLSSLLLPWTILESKDWPHYNLIQPIFKPEDCQELKLISTSVSGLNAGYGVKKQFQTNMHNNITLMSDAKRTMMVLFTTTRIQPGFWVSLRTGGQMIGKRMSMF